MVSLRKYIKHWRVSLQDCQHLEFIMVSLRKYIKHCRVSLQDCQHLEFCEKKKRNRVVPFYPLLGFGNSGETRSLDIWPRISKHLIT